MVLVAAPVATFVRVQPLVIAALQVDGVGHNPVIAMLAVKYRLANVLKASRMYLWMEVVVSMARLARARHLVIVVQLRATAVRRAIAMLDVKQHSAHALAVPTRYLLTEVAARMAKPAKARHSVIAARPRATVDQQAIVKLDVNRPLEPAQLAPIRFQQTARAAQTERHAKALPLGTAAQPKVTAAQTAPSAQAAANPLTVAAPRPHPQFPPTAAAGQMAKLAQALPLAHAVHPKATAATPKTSVTQAVNLLSVPAPPILLTYLSMESVAPMARHVTCPHMATVVHHKVFAAARLHSVVQAARPILAFASFRLVHL